MGGRWWIVCRGRRVMGGRLIVVCVGIDGDDGGGFRCERRINRF